MVLRIKEILKQRGVTQKGLAEKIGVSIISISRIAQGEQNPSLDTLQKIAEALGVSLADLFAERENGVIICPHCGKKILVEAKQAQSANDGAKQSE